MRRLVLAVVILAALAVARPAAAVPGDARVQGGLPYLKSIDLAPGGAIWATAPRAERIVRITPGPTTGVQGFPVPTRLDGPQELVVADDGSVWFTTGPRSSEDLGRVDPTTGDVTTFAVPGGRVFGELVVDGDGRLWAGASQSRLARIDVADGVVDPLVDVTFVDVPRDGSVEDLDVARDGTVWIGVRSPDLASFVGHVVGTDVDVHNAGSFGGTLAVASGGNVWFTAGQNVVRLDPRTDAKRTFTGPRANGSGGTPILFGPDGELWRLDRVLSRIDPASGDVDFYRSPARYGDDLLVRRGRLWGLAMGKLLRIQAGAPGETDHRDPSVDLRSPVDDGHYRVDERVPVDVACRAAGGGRIVDCFAARQPAVTPNFADGSSIGFPYVSQVTCGGYARDQAGNTADVRIEFHGDPVCFDRRADLVDGDYHDPGTDGDDVLAFAFRGGQGTVHGRGGDDRLCSAGVIDGGPGYDRCQGSSWTVDTFVSCEVVVDP